MWARLDFLTPAVLGTLALVGAECATCWDVTNTNHLSPFLPELAYDLDMDDTSANKQLLNQQSKGGATISNSDPRNAAPSPGPAAAITLLLLLGHKL